MDENIRKILRLICEILLLVVTVSLSFFITFGLKLPKRGFICHDPSLSYPLLEQTVDVKLLVIICIGTPHCIMILTELYNYFHESKGNRRNYSIFNSQIPSILINLYIYVGIFWFGISLSELISNTAKVTVGHLRPHFFDACKPIMSDGTTCYDKINQNKFIIDYKCTEAESLDTVVADIGHSFPSGHSSLMFYSMTFLALYIETKWKMHQIPIIKIATQFLFILLAWFVAMSRLRDYYHHFIDVMGGCLIGLFAAIYITKFAYKSCFTTHKKKKNKFRGDPNHVHSQFCSINIKD